MSENDKNTNNNKNINNENSNHNDDKNTVNNEINNKENNIDNKNIPNQGNVKDIKQSPAQEFTFLPREDNRADFTINGNNGKTKNISDVTNSKAEHYIKVNPEYNVDTIRKQLDTIDFEIVSSVNGGVAWLGQNDILRHWHNRR